ncbi:uncharacterized protein [Anolis sagrei]|uniref:uncharacterized protein isoform X2 n=1 Tax=Anolis sagrei TaxID=38937 RepID=UPI003520016A
MLAIKEEAEEDLDSLTGSSDGCPLVIAGEKTPVEDTLGPDGQPGQCKGNPAGEANEVDSDTKRGSPLRWVVKEEGNGNATVLSETELSLPPPRPSFSVLSSQHSIRMAPRTRAQKKAARREAASKTRARPTRGRGDAAHEGSQQSAAKPVTNRAPSRRSTEPDANILEGISENIAKLLDRIDKLESKVFSETAPQGSKQHHKKRRRRTESPEPTSRKTGHSGSASREDKAEAQCYHRTSSTRKKKKHRSSRCCQHYTSESDSSESEYALDPVDRDNYWRTAALVPGLPEWAIRCRIDSGSIYTSSGTRRGGRSPTQVLPPLFLDNEDPPGTHLSRRLRNKILRGYYVDIFSLLEPEGEEGWEPPTKRRHRKRDTVRPVERSFVNWIAGYSVYMGVVAAAFPERGWHLINHQIHVLRARKLAGEIAAIAYDTAFRKRASQSARTRWDLINHDIWLTEVMPSIRGKHETGRYDRSWGKKDARRAVCWEFNMGKCQRAHCRFDHVCE